MKLEKRITSRSVSKSSSCVSLTDNLFLYGPFAFSFCESFALCKDFSATAEKPTVFEL